MQVATTGELEWRGRVAKATVGGNFVIIIIAIVIVTILAMILFVEIFIVIISVPMLNAD